MALIKGVLKLQSVLRLSACICIHMQNYEVHLCIPFLGIARPQSQFPLSCVGEQFTYIFPGSVHIFRCTKIERPILEIYKSLTDICCRNCETKHFNSALEVKKETFLLVSHWSKTAKRSKKLVCLLLSWKRKRKNPVSLNLVLKQNFLTTHNRVSYCGAECLLQCFGSVTFLYGSGSADPYL
jgi:hypothetical protein